MIGELMKKAVWLRDLNMDRVFEKTAQAQFPGSPCAFRAVAGTLPLIKNSYALLLGPEICLYNAKLTMSIRSLTDEPLPNNLLFLVFSNQDIIFGVSDKIKTAIKDICTRYKPEVLFIVTTCLQEIIGEDFDSLLEETAKEVAVPLLGIHTENFTCDSAAPGLENTSLALINLMKPQKTEKNAINILGLRIQKPQKTELVKLLHEKGIIVKNVFPSFCTPQELEKAPAAELNLVMEQSSLALAEEMQARFGCKYVYCERPYTPDEIARMYNRIAEALKINLKDEIQEMKNEVQEKMRRLKTNFAGKSCVIGMLQGVQSGRYFDLAELLLLLGMEIKGMILREVLRDDWEDIKRLKAAGYDFPIIDAGNTLQNEIFLTGLQPDFYIGNGDIEHFAKMGIEPKNLMLVFRKTGFSALKEVLELLGKTPPGYKTLLYKEQIVKKWGAV